MATDRRFKHALGWGLAGLLAACGNAPDTPVGRVRKDGPLPTQMVATVRDAGAAGVELEVQPLRDPQIEDLRAQALALETAGKIRQADATLQQALALTPEDPELVQWRAELALLGKQWLQAEHLASASYERGPKLGGLCRRNWTTVELSRTVRKDAAGAEVARQQRARCTIAPPVRM